MYKKRIIIGAMIACVLVPMLQSECFAATHYVVTNGTPGVSSANPYTNWATAGTNIIDVVNAAMTNTATRVVWVSNGTYYLTNQVSITNALTIQSVNGRDVTIVDGNNYSGKPVTNRCFNLTASGAVLDGFIITNGCYIGSVAGGGVYCAANTTVKNCRITGCIATNVYGTTSQAGGALVYGIMTNCEVIGNISYGSAGGIYLGTYLGPVGLVANCIVASNLVVKYKDGTADQQGAGIYAASAVIRNCVIYGNTYVNASSCYGGGVLLSAATLCNSLVYGNTATHGGGVGIYNSYGIIQNCTVVSNVATVSGGGLYTLTPSAKTTYVENVVCYLNSGGASSNIYFSNTSIYTGSYHVVNSCIAPTNAFPTGGMEGYFYTNNIGANPLFVNKDTGDWRLSQGSLCVNTGTNQDWMTGAVDLDGRRRICYGTVDMGAYEFIYNGTVYRIP